MVNYNTYIGDIQAFSLIPDSVEYWPMKWSLLIILLSLGFIETAQARIYQIELIVFSHLTQQSVSQEQWPMVNPNDFDLNNALRLKADNNQSDNYTLLPPNQFTLKKEQQALNKKSTYHTLLHVAWRQVVYAPRDSRAVSIEGGNTYNIDGKTQRQLTGTVRVSIQRYLNVSLNLLFIAPTSQLSHLANNDYFANAGPYVYFHLSQNRRMRSKELNYIDFPLYGVLIKVIPIPEN